MTRREETADCGEGQPAVSGCIDNSQFPILPPTRKSSLTIDVIETARLKSQALAKMCLAAGSGDFGHRFESRQDKALLLSFGRLAAAVATHLAGFEQWLDEDGQGAA